MERRPALVSLAVSRLSDLSRTPPREHSSVTRLDNTLPLRLWGVMPPEDATAGTHRREALDLTIKRKLSPAENSGAGDVFAAPTGVASRRGQRNRGHRSDTSSCTAARVGKTRSDT